MSPLPKDLLVCPDCQGALEENAGSPTCRVCDVRYDSQDGVLRLVGRRSRLNESETAVQDFVSDFYEDARYKFPWSKRYHEHTLESLTDLCPPEGRVLDNGCGNGVFLEFMTRRFPDVDLYVGSDISLGMLRHARARLARIQAEHQSTERTNRVDLHLVQADALRLPFANESFDLVFARGLLHHLPDPVAGAKEMARVLRPGGSVLLLDPNRNVVSELPRRLAKRGDHFDEDHKNFYVRELRRILDPYFSIRRQQFFGYVAYPLLGFPDLVSFGRYLPLERWASPLLYLDDQLARIPGLRRLGWGVMMHAVRQA